MDAEKELNNSEEQAKTILEDEEKSETLADKAENLIKDLTTPQKKKFLLGRIRDLSTYSRIFISLLRSYARKEYREIPLGTIVAIVAALIYFVSPVDFLPDFIPGFGYVDDAAVIGFCFLAFKSDLDAYQRWQIKHTEVIDQE